MRKWTWQWLALIGLGWMMLGVFAFVQVDLLPLIPLIDEDVGCEIEELGVLR